MRTLRRTRFAPLLLVPMVALGVSLPLTVAEMSEAGQGAEVVVEDPGAEPRQLLRYHYTEGQTEGFALDMDMGMSMDMFPGGSTGWLDSPTITMLGTTTVVESHDDGTYTIEMAITGEETRDEGDQAPAAQPGTQSPSMVGMTTRARMDERGRALDVETTMPPGYVAPEGVPQPDQFDAMAANMAQPLPEEPVGAGAVWEVLTSDASMGFELKSVTTVTLDELRPDGSFTATGEMEARAEEQAFTMPGMPDDVEATVDFYDMTGSYQWDIDPTRLVQPNEGHAIGFFGFTVSALGETVYMETEVEFGVVFRPVPAE